MSESLEQCLYPTKLECVRWLENRMNQLISGYFSQKVINILNQLSMSIAMEWPQYSHDSLIPKGLIETMTQEIEMKMQENERHDKIARELGDYS